MTRKEKLMGKVEKLVLEAGGSLRPWRRSRWGFYAICTCCGGLAAITISSNEIRELPHCTEGGQGQ